MNTCGARKHRRFFDRQLLIDAFEHAAQHDLHLTDEAGLVKL